MSHAAPWLNVDHSAGSTPDVLHLTFDTAALGLGTARDTLRFVASGVTVTVPVELQLYPLTVSQMVTDFERPYIYALHPGTGQSDDAFVLFVNTASEQIEKAHPDRQESDRHGAEPGRGATVRDQLGAAGDARGGPGDPDRAGAARRWAPTSTR